MWSRTSLRRQMVSIHASAREATGKCPYDLGDSGFQSTPPRGRRRKKHSEESTSMRVSIHASAREATCISIILDG